jgi:M6 family metalloprotease-like protein
MFLMSLVSLIIFSVTATAALAGANDLAIAKQFYSSSPTDGAYCSVSGNTLRRYAPNSIFTNGALDPFFAGGGYMMGETMGTVKAYVICVDFADCPGYTNDKITEGDLQNVFVTDGMEYDYRDPETFYKVIFEGSDGFGRDFAGTDTYDGVIKFLDQISYGKMTFDVEILNARPELKAANGGKAPWFRLPGLQRDYAIQYAAEVEDYRIFARLHQAAVDIAYQYIQNLDLSDIDFLYVTTPINTFGFRSGLQGGAGIDTSYSYQGQSLLLRDTEFRHTPGVVTHEGRIVDSGCTITKGARNSYGGDANYWRTLAHETSHGLGLIDDYTYSATDHYSATSNSWSTPVGNWGIMGGMTGPKPDWPAWYKFKAGWLGADDIQTVKPGESVEIIISALASKKGSYDQGKKMVLIPTEWRTIDTFHNKDIWGTNNNQPWNPNETAYNYLDWFTPVWLGGETHAVKSYPTGYVLESRRAIEADRGGTGVGPSVGNSNTSHNRADGTQGVLITQLDNLTWETGHGAAGLKVMRNPDISSPNNACIGLSPYSGTGTEPYSWEDQIRGIKVEVLESTAYYDKVRITYKGYDAATQDYQETPNAVERKYQGVLSLGANYVTEGQDFTVNFDLFTLGRAATNGDRLTTANKTGAAGRAQYHASPLGVPAGVSSFTMEVSFDQNIIEYTGAGDSSPFSFTVDDSDAAAGKLLIQGSSQTMRDGSILNLGFSAIDPTSVAGSAGDTVGTSGIEASLTDLAVLNFWGDEVRAGTSGGPGVYLGIDTYPSIQAVSGGYDALGPGEGLVVINAARTYAVSGIVQVEAPDGTLVGVESTIDIYDGGDALVASTKSSYDGHYSIPNVPAGSGYYLKINRHAYDEFTSAAFNVSVSDVSVPPAELAKTTVTISGVVYGDSGTNPLAGAKVQLKDGGFLNVGAVVTTDEQGRFAITGVPAMGNAFYTLTATKDGYGNSYGLDYGIGKGDLFDATADVERNVTLTSKYSISGIISPNTASDAPQYTLKLYNGSSQLVSEIQGADVRSGNTVIRNFMFENVSPGEGYYFEVSRPLYVTKRSTPFNIIDANVLRKNLTLSRAGIPGSPTDISAAAGNREAIVTFLPPENDGGNAITGYTVTSSPGGLTGDGAAAPITVSGLTNGTEYTFTVTATNEVGAGPDSESSNSVTPSTAAQDNSDIAAAKAAIEGAVYTAEQAAIANTAQAKAAVAAKISTLGLNGVTAYVNDVLFTEAIAGTLENHSGVPGLYAFTVNLSKGVGTRLTTDQRVLTINAAAYTVDPGNSVTIGGTSVNLDRNASGAGWIWDAENHTLALTGGDVGAIDLATANDSRVIVMDDASADSITNSGAGNLAIEVATNKTLTVDSAVGPAISAKGDITIDGAIVNASTADNTAAAIESETGSVTILGDVTLTAGASGGSAVKAAVDVNISTAGKVSASTENPGYAIEAGHAILITNGATELFAGDDDHAFNVTPDITEDAVKVSVNGTLIHGGDSDSDSDTDTSGGGSGGCAAGAAALALCAAIPFIAGKRRG